MVVNFVKEVILVVLKSLQRKQRRWGSVVVDLDFDISGTFDEHSFLMNYILKTDDCVLELVWMYQVLSVYGNQMKNYQNLK